MKIINFFLGLFISCTLVSCYVLYNFNPHADKDMKRIQLGMDKNQVIQIVGSHFQVAAASKDEKGDYTEVLCYNNGDDEEYNLKFINNKLIEWHKEHIYKYQTPYNSDNSTTKTK